jgi:hypothetical protein
MDRRGSHTGQEVAAMETKKPRGRPPMLSPEYIAGIQALYPELKTRRSILNMCYENRALGVIDEMQKEGTEGLKFLVDTKRDSYRWGVLRELGKSSSEGTLTPAGIRSLALRICQEAKTERQTAREWVHRVKLIKHRIFWETVS